MSSGRRRATCASDRTASRPQLTVTHEYQDTTYDAQGIKTKRLIETVVDIVLLLLTAWLVFGDLPFLGYVALLFVLGLGYACHRTRAQGARMIVIGYPVADTDCTLTRDRAVRSLGKLEAVPCGRPCLRLDHFRLAIPRRRRRRQGADQHRRRRHLELEVWLSRVKPPRADTPPALMTDPALRPRQDTRAER